jgi:hypothetical protein
VNVFESGSPRRGRKDVRGCPRGFDVTLDIFWGDTDRPPPIPDAVGCQPLGPDQLVDQAWGDAEPFGNLGDGQQWRWFGVAVCHRLLTLNRLLAGDIVRRARPASAGQNTWTLC